MASKTVRRAMRSLAAKGGARLVETPPMTVYPIRQAPQAPPPVRQGRDPAGSRARAGSPAGADASAGPDHRVRRLGRHRHRRRQSGHRTPWPGHHSDQTKDKFKDKPQPLIRLS
jgi:hypothetical protein